MLDGIASHAGVAQRPPHVGAQAAPATVSRPVASMRAGPVGLDGLFELAVGADAGVAEHGALAE